MVYCTIYNLRLETYFHLKLYSKIWTDTSYDKHLIDRFAVKKKALILI